MRVREDRLRKKRSFFTILILLSFILSVLPGGMGNIRAEELSSEEPVETVELVAEVIWTGIPEEMTIPNTTINLMSGKNVVESKEIAVGSLEAKFTPVAKFNDAGEEILYSVSQDPLENFTTDIREFIVENTYVEPVVEVRVEEPVVEEPVVEEPVTEEPVADEIVEAPPAEETPKVDESPPLEEAPAMAETPVPEVEAPQESPETVVDTNSVNLQADIGILAVPNEGIYVSDPGFDMIETDHNSINELTYVKYIWVQDGVVFMAITALDYIDITDGKPVGEPLGKIDVTINGTYPSGVTYYGEPNKKDQKSIIIDGTPYSPVIKNDMAFWAVIYFEPDNLPPLYDTDNVVWYNSRRGGGHDVEGETFNVVRTNYTFVVKKIWSVNHPPTLPPVTFNIIFGGVTDVTTDPLTGTVDGTVEGIAVGESQGETEAWIYTWLKVPKTNAYGQEYSYTVTENTLDGYTTTGPVGPVKTDEGLTWTYEFTNIYNNNNVDVTAYKKWVGGPKPTVYFQLWQKIGEAESKVLNRPPEKITSTDLEANWEDLPEYSGTTTIIYFVKEVDVDGNEFTPSNYEKSYSEDRLTITNTYTSPLTDIVARKIWENGDPDKHVAVTLTLYRQIGVEPKTEVIGVTPTIVPPSGPASEFVYTWSDLDKTDFDGNEYIYTVDELVVPDGYEKSISTDGLTVTNKAKTSSLQLLKIGVNETPLKGAEFELYRKVESTTTDAVEFEDKDGNTIYGLLVQSERLITDDEGLTQKIDNLEVGDYFVIEVVAPQGYKIHEYPIEFTIVATVTLNEFAIENEEAPMIPATGGMGTWLFTILGAGIMGGALLGFKKFNNKDKGKGENTMKSRKLFTFLFTMLVLFVFIAPSMAKAVEGNSVAARTTNVTIHKMELFTPKAGLPKDHDGTVLTPAQLDAALGIGNYAPLPGVAFSYWELDMTKPAAQLTPEYLNTSLTIDTDHTFKGTLITSDPDGTIFLDKLPDGYYFFKETPQPYNVVTTYGVPFILGLPVMNIDGRSFIKDLHIYPKNVTQRGAVVLTKYAADGITRLPGAEFELFKGEPNTGTSLGKITTNAQGEIIVNDLLFGDYYFIETIAPKVPGSDPVVYYLINTKPIMFKIEANGEVILDDDDLRVDEEGIVKFIERKNFVEPDISKSIETIGNSASSGFFNEELKFFIDIVVPADIWNYTKLEVSDMISTKLDYKNDLMILGSVDNGVNYYPLAVANYLYVVTQPVFNGDGLLKIEFKPERLLFTVGVVDTPLTNIRISFKAAINETAIMGQGIVNKAKVDYNNGSTNGDDTSNEVKAFTGGKNFIKIDGLGEDAKKLAGAEFAVKNAAGAAGKFLYVDPVTGAYTWVNTLAETPFRLTSSSDPATLGLFSIKGLKYDLTTTGTTYFLYETKAPMSTAGYPYNLIETDIPFLVNGSSYYADLSSITDGTAPPDAMPDGVVNVLGPKIPQTGGIGTALFTLIGGGLMGFAVLLNKKRSRS